jgi:hypothetical protein
VVESLPSNCEAQSSNPSTTKKKEIKFLVMNITMCKIKKRTLDEIREVSVGGTIDLIPTASYDLTSS